VPDGYELSPSDPKPRIDAPSLLNAPGAEPCPRCGKPVAPEAVLCVSCGYDVRTHATTPIQTGVALEDDPKPMPEFVKPGLGSAQTIAIAGAVVLLAAVITTLIAGPAGRPPGAPAATVPQTVAAVLLILVNGFMHSATGLLALGATAWLTDHRFGRVDLGAARMFLIFSVFQLMLTIPLPWTPAVALGTKWLAASAAYWLLAMALFRKGPEPAGMLGGVHLLLFLLVNLAVWAQTVLRGALAVDPAAAG
jgi:hypothetical protein